MDNPGDQDENRLTDYEETPSQSDVSKPSVQDNCAPHASSESQPRGNSSDSHLSANEPASEDTTGETLHETYSEASALLNEINSSVISIESNHSASVDHEQTSLQSNVQRRPTQNNLFSSGLPDKSPVEPSPPANFMKGLKIIPEDPESSESRIPEAQVARRTSHKKRTRKKKNAPTKNVASSLSEHINPDGLPHFKPNAHLPDFNKSRFYLPRNPNRDNDAIRFLMTRLSSLTISSDSHLTEQNTDALIEYGYSSDESNLASYLQTNIVLYQYYNVPSIDPAYGYEAEPYPADNSNFAPYAPEAYMAPYQYYDQPPTGQNIDPAYRYEPPIYPSDNPYPSGSHQPQPPMVPYQFYNQPPTEQNIVPSDGHASGSHQSDAYMVPYQYYNQPPTEQNVVPPVEPYPSGDGNHASYPSGSHPPQGQVPYQHYNQPAPYYEILPGTSNARYPNPVPYSQNTAGPSYSYHNYQFQYPSGSEQPVHNVGMNHPQPQPWQYGAAALPESATYFLPEPPSETESETSVLIGDTPSTNGYATSEHDLD